MRGIDATFDDLSCEGGDGPRRVLLKILPGAAAVALAGALGVWLLHWRGSVAPEAMVSRTNAPTAWSAISRPFGDIVIDKRLLARLKAPAPASSLQVASLKAAPRPSLAPIPLPSLEPFPPAPAPASSLQVARLEAALRPSLAPIPLPSLEPFPPTPAIPQASGLPAPPARDIPEIGESLPFPPARPPELAEPAQPQAPERPAVRPEAAVARPAGPADNRNFIEKLIGLGRPSAPAAVPAQPARVASPTMVGEAQERQSGGGRSPLLAFFSAFGRSSAPTSGYDRHTAVYDISARTVTLPDGTKLEAHSGLGPALDNPRFASARARGPTPPHLYQLTLREGSFHGVQAIRLNPIGDGGVYGRAGLLAHPFMLGPSGQSNGCVSFKHYNAFLRAYEDGEINKLAVVAGL